MKPWWWLIAPLTVLPLPGQTVSGVDEQVVLETAPSVDGIVVLARPPFVSWLFKGAELHFALEDLIETVPFRSDASGRISLSYRTTDRFNLVVQAVWLSGKSLAASEAVHLRRNPYAAWQNGPPHDPNVWPIGVWLQDPARAADYAAIGINFYCGLWQGPTESQLTALASAGMPAFASQNAVGLASANRHVLDSWTQVDEPDNAQWNSQAQRYDPPILPSVIQQAYRDMKAKDATRPVFLNFGPGLADELWGGRGTRTGKLEDYPEYIQGADIVSFDIYPIADPTRVQVAGQLHYVGNGVRRLSLWAKEKSVMNFIEAAGVNKGTRPTPAQIRAEVLMSIVNGANGTMYFVHEFKPAFIEDTVLKDPILKAGVTAINARLRELAPVLHAPSIGGAVQVAADVRIVTLVKRQAGKTWLLAVNMEPKNGSATFTLRGVGTGTISVLDESRTLPVQGGVFRDSFGFYDARIYRLD